jgi:hypothetical protein
MGNELFPGTAGTGRTESNPWTAVFGSDKTIVRDDRHPGDCMPKGIQSYRASRQQGSGKVNATITASGIRVNKETEIREKMGKTTKEANANPKRTERKLKYAQNRSGICSTKTERGRDRAKREEIEILQENLEEAKDAKKKQKHLSKR